jgi:hypothetical protein
LKSTGTSPIQTSPTEYISFEDFLKGSEIMGCREDKDKCNCKHDCLCRLLRRFVGQTVTINTKSGDVITGELQRVRRCCVRIIEPGSVSPPLGSTLTVIRCEDIESFSVALLG